VLLMETDGHPAVIAEEAEIMAQLARKNGALEVRVAATTEESLRLATARRSAFAALARVAPTTILEDVTVPRSELAGMVAFIQDLAQRHNLRIGVFGTWRRQPPSNLPHERKRRGRDASRRTRLREIVTETVRRAGPSPASTAWVSPKRNICRVGGRPHVEIMRNLKRLFDPNLILNPGKMFDC